MHARRFGQRLKLPSTVAIKHQFFMMMLEQEIGATPAGQAFHPESSQALANLRRLAARRNTVLRRGE